MPLSLRSQSYQFLEALQLKIVAKLEALDPNGPKFVKQNISASSNIINVSYVLQRTDADRKVHQSQFAPLEKAILTWTQVNNRMPPNISADFLKGQGARNPDVTTPAGGTSFFAANLTVFVHPRSPHAPTGHGTWRYIEVLNNDNQPIDWWFGGACNLTPSYLYDDDCKHFHGTFKSALSKYGEHTHAPLKKWCDDYFYYAYRKEQCGIGGIFFDGLSSSPHKKLDVHGDATQRPRSPDDCLAFFKSTGDAFVSAYMPILNRRALTAWTREERDWQLVQRGRFVEFCLLIDEGVKFGIQTGSGSLDAILLILPETAQWAYGLDETNLGEREARLVKALKEPRDWV